MRKILEADHLTQRFGGLTAVRDVSFYIGSDETLAIIGPNGAGKTTLFNMITGIYKPSEGEIFLHGKNATGQSPDALSRAGMARTFQNIRLFGQMMAVDNVLTAMHHAPEQKSLIGRLSGRTEKELLIKAETILRKTGLYKYRYHDASSLAYGLQRKLEIARALATEPSLLLLDEPAAGMNEQETDELVELIRKLRSDGLAICLIEHDMRFVMSISDRILVLNHGEKIAEGRPAEIRKSPAVIDAYLGRAEDDDVAATAACPRSVKNEHP